MNAIADQLDRLAERGPHADPGLVVARANSIATGTLIVDDPAPDGPRWRPILVAVATAVIVVGGITLVATRPAGDAPGNPTPTAITPSGTAPGSSPPADDTVLGPVETLPDLADVHDVVPPTVVGTGPTDWYRLQPDLDVAWYSPNDGTSMLCVRTPTLDATCQPDRAAAGGGPIGVTTAGDQLIVVTLDPGDTVTLTLDDGTTVTAPITRDPQINWGTARFHLDGNAAATGLTATYAAAAATPTQDTTPADQPAPDLSATGPTIVPEQFPTVVPRPDTFESMNTLTDDSAPVGWEFLDSSEPTAGIERCTRYAATFDDTWTSTPDTDESPSVLYAHTFTNADWQVGIYCTDLGDYLIQVMPASAEITTPPS